MCGWLASARWRTISAAVCPCAAQCILFCTVLKNCCGQVCVAVIVDAGCVDVGDLLVEEPLAGANVANPRQQFVEVVLPERAAGLDALVVERESLDQQFAEPRRGPLTELGAAGRPHAVADGQRSCRGCRNRPAAGPGVIPLVELSSIA